MTELTHVSLFSGIGNDDNSVSHKHWQYRTVCQVRVYSNVILPLWLSFRLINLAASQIADQRYKKFFP